LHTPKSHTHMQQVARCTHVHTGGGSDGLDRGTLTRIDRRVHSRLGDEERDRMVWLPVAEATWSTWKRYCDAARIAMGRAIVALINHELGAVVVRPMSISCARETSHRATRGEACGPGPKRAQAGCSSGTAARERTAAQNRGNTDPIHTGDVVATPRIESKGGPQRTMPMRSGFKYMQCYGLSGRL